METSCYYIYSNIRMKYGWACWHFACEKGHLQIVQYLIEKGANIEEKDQRRQPPFHPASLQGKTDVVKYLVDKDANKNAQNKEEKLHMMLFPWRSERDDIREFLKSIKTFQSKRSYYYSFLKPSSFLFISISLIGDEKRMIPFA